MNEADCQKANAKLKKDPDKWHEVLAKEKGAKRLCLKSGYKFPDGSDLVIDWTRPEEKIMYPPGYPYPYQV